MAFAPIPVSNNNTKIIERQLAQLLEQPLAVVGQLCLGLADAYDAAGHGFQFVKVAGGWRYQTHPDLSPYVERFLLDGQRARMSGAALETLAIVAYKQPISRAQVASIRGVDPDGVLRTLAARGYVAQVAIDPGPGQAALFGTTPQFLEKLGLNSLSDLPPLAEFVPGADVVEALEIRIARDRTPTRSSSAPTHQRCRAMNCATNARRTAHEGRTNDWPRDRKAVVGAVGRPTRPGHRRTFAEGARRCAAGAADGSART